MIALIVLESENVRLYGQRSEASFGRYREHLSPDIVRDPWTRDEDLAILYGQQALGNRWAEM